MKYLLIGLGFLTVAFHTKGQGNTNPLLSSAFWQSKPGLELVKAEVGKGADATELNGASFDPVVLAINAGAPNDAVLYLFNQKGNDANKLTHDGRTYVFWAAYRGNTELMNHFISKGAKMDLVDNHGYSVMNFAASTGQQNIAVYDIAIKHGAKPATELNHDGANALLLAIGSDTAFKLTSYFESKGLSLNSTDTKGANAFDYAARTGNMFVMKTLLEKGVKPTNNAMLMAAQGTKRGANGPEVFAFIESLGIKPSVSSKSGDNALHAVVRRPGQTELIKYFISKGTDVNAQNENGNTVFMNAAASNRDIEILKLIKAGTKNINQKNKDGETALSIAVRSNSPEIVQFLIAGGADASVLDNKGNSLVYYLFESYSPSNAKNFEAKLKILQENAVKILQPLKDGSTIYHLAVAKNDLNLLKLIQPLGADINAVNSEKFTALHKAALLAKDDAVMKFLLANGAKKEIKTGFDETAFDLAAENEKLKKEKVSIEFLK